jgi:hypothetical protein
VHAHHWLILHGRYVCLARKPRCGACAVRPGATTAAHLGSMARRLQCRRGGCRGSTMATLDDLAERVDRLVLRHEELSAPAR